VTVEGRKVMSNHSEPKNVAKMIMTKQ